MTKVPKCESCGRVNTFVESQQSELCAVCETAEKKDKNNNNKK